MSVADEQASDLGGSAADGSEYYPNGSPYRIQRHAANIRERKRMLRSAPAPRPPAPHTHERPPVKMWGSGGRGNRLPNLLAQLPLSYFRKEVNSFSHEAAPRQSQVYGEVQTYQKWLHV